MIELFWIKSLLSFLVMCLCVLSWMIVNSYKKASLVRKWQPLLAVWSVIYWGAFLQFTTWISDSSPFITAIYDSSLSFRFLLGPLLLFGLFRRTSKKTNFIHFTPFAVALFYSMIYLPGSLFILLSHLHCITYFVWAWLSSKHISFSIEGKLALSMVLKLWIASSIILSLELILWSQYNLISEKTAWILYIISSLTLCSSFVYLSYKFGVRDFHFEIKSQPKLPILIEKHLGEKLVPYLKHPDVYRDPLIDIKKVARNLRVSPHHISNFLNQHYGEGFVSIINNQRVEEVIQKLETTHNRHLSIQEIYFSVGFNSKSTFIAAFKRKTGVTPSAFRRAASSKKEKLPQKT